VTNVRRAVPDDLATLLVLVAEYCEADGHEFDAGVARAGLEPLLADDSLGVVWMIGDDDGYAVVTWGWSVEIGGLDVVLDEIYVRSRGRGKASAAMRVIEDDLRARGVKRIVLETERPNDAARRLYTRLGFTAEDSIWMSKVLGG
jgi:ribosomal protein S18 acetylase RimI-like enzyme